MNEEFTIEVSLPDKCLSPNSRAHHFQVYRAKQVLRANVASAVRVFFPEFVDARWKSAEIEYAFYFKGKRNRDDDNYRSMMKAGRDALQPEKLVVAKRGKNKGRMIVHIGVGVVEDDTNIRDIGEVGMHIDRKNPRVEITVRRTG